MWNRRLGRTADHRVALFRNLATDLILKGKIETTEMKAKELRSVVDHLITVAKKDDLAARRNAAAYLRNVTTKDGKEPNLLEIAGTDGQYAPAGAKIRGNRLILKAGGVSHPVHARYAWTDYSDQVNLAGENGLPVEPFSL